MKKILYVLLLLPLLCYSQYGINKGGTNYQINGFGAPSDYDNGKIRNQLPLFTDWQEGAVLPIDREFYETDYNTEN